MLAAEQSNLTSVNRLVQRTKHECTQLGGISRKRHTRRLAKDIGRKLSHFAEGLRVNGRQALQELSR